jgi:O-antigen/teichoic acid export membrane protein
MNYARSVSAQAVSRILYVATGTAVFVVLARLLGPEDLGRYAVVISLLNIAISTADFGTTMIFSRDLAAAGEGRAQYVGAFIVLRLCLGCAVAICAMAIAVAVSPSNLTLTLLACSVLIPLGAARYFDLAFQVYGRPWLSTWLGIVYTAVLPLLTLLALAAREYTAQWAAVAYAMSGAVYGMAGLFLMVRLEWPDFVSVTFGAIRRIMVAAAPLGAANLLGMLTLRLDVVLLGVLGTEDMIGKYNAAFRFFDLGAAVVVTVLSPLVPVFARHAARDPNLLRASFIAIIRVVAVACVLAALVAPGLSSVLLGTLYGKQYAAAAGVLDLLAWKFLLGTINLFFVAFLVTVTPVRFVLISALCGLGLNIALNALLIPRFGITGAAVSALLTEFPQVAITLFVVWRVSPGALEPAWWGRLGLALLAGEFTLRMCPGPGPARAAVAAAVFFAGLSGLGAFPANPLPALRVGD